LVFDHSGHVADASVDAPYRDTSEGDCIVRAASAAVVPPFTRERFSVRAPFTMGHAPNDEPQ
jgi:hypothetical protein